MTPLYKRIDALFAYYFFAPAHIEVDTDNLHQITGNYLTQ